MFFLGTEIFWTALIAVFAILFLSTLIGSVWTIFLPYKSRSPGLFYLSPLFGLASLTIIATLIGKILPLGNNLIIPCLIAAFLLGVFLQERQLKSTIYHASLIGLFGLLCGLSILTPLFLFGAINTHNDSFLYLSHSNWLQSHAFNQLLTQDEMTPLKTSVAIFQEQGLRMGASFLLALFQGLFRISWSYELYPAILISAITACCLAVGFPLAASLRSFRRLARFILLAIPAFTVGGLVWGASNGFFSQTIGLSFGAGLLFLIGPLFNWIAVSKPANFAILKATVPCIILLVAVTFAYPELDPFLILGIGSSALLMAFRSKCWRKMVVCLGFLFCVSALILNSELMRVYSALRLESGAIVGRPIDWSLLGYITHIFGISAGHGISTFKWGLLIAFILIIIIERRSLWSAITNGKLMPATLVLLIFFTALLFYRYVVPSPFTKGVGQSWSQFKLSDWANPCMMVLVLAAIAGLQRKFGRLIETLALPVFFIFCLSHSLNLNIKIFQDLMTTYYAGVSDLNQFYLTIRKEVSAQCPVNKSIYLALKSEDYKFRQMLTYYFFDREIKSDWTDDAYIYPFLNPEIGSQKPQYGDCIIEPKNGGLVEKGIDIGRYHIGVYERQQFVSRP